MSNQNQDLRLNWNVCLGGRGEAVFGIWVKKLIEDGFFK